MLSTSSANTVCLACRLRLLSAVARRELHSSTRPLNGTSTTQRRPTQPTKRLSSSGRRHFSSSARRSEALSEVAHNESHPETSPPPILTPAELEANVRQARQRFGEHLPENHLSREEYTLYERLYGPAVITSPLKDGELDALEAVAEGEVDGLPTNQLFREDAEGEMVEVQYHQEDDTPGMVAGVEANEGISDGELEPALEEVERLDLTSKPEIDMIADEYYEEEEEVDDDDTAAAVADQVDDPNALAGEHLRAHPYTIAARFGTSPSSVKLPRGAFAAPVSLLLSQAKNKHLDETAHEVFGGKGLPNSGRTLRARLPVPQKPIALDATQTTMSNIEADAYMAAVMPATYASVTSALVEVRKRLGSAWSEGLLQKKRGPWILDAGAGGAAVVAWREILRAEWTRMNESESEFDAMRVPYGRATVLTGSETLRVRASALLENTTFLPRLPDTIFADSQRESEKQKRYDIIIAPHTLWQLKEEYERKQQVQKLWSLLEPDGGVLILLEKGVPRGFEVIASARQMLLDSLISSPSSDVREIRLDDPSTSDRFVVKETGMIVAPCTNHEGCPMYQTPGVSQGRKDFCHFTQRYERPAFLQRLIGARDRNHEDVQFSYIAVQRGRDQRREVHERQGGRGLVQGKEGTDRAFGGYELPHDDDAVEESNDTIITPQRHQLNTLGLPRTILPPLKRRGHVILDVCTPSGTLERWTVPRSFGKQAYRDARKSSWGDLWALGAKTRTARNVRLGRPSELTNKKKKSGDKVVNMVYNDEGDMKVAHGKRGKDRKDKQGRKGRREKPLDVEQIIREEQRMEREEKG